MTAAARKEVVSATDREQAVRDFLAAYDSLESNVVQLCREVLHITHVKAWLGFPDFKPKGTGSIVVEFLRFLKPAAEASQLYRWSRFGDVINALDLASGPVSLDLLRNEHQLRQLLPVLNDYDDKAVVEVWDKAVQIAAAEGVAPNRAIIARARNLTGNVSLKPIRPPRVYDEDDVRADYNKARDAINRILTYDNPEPWLTRFSDWFNATTTAAGY